MDARVFVVRASEAASTGALEEEVYDDREDALGAAERLGNELGRRFAVFEMDEEHEVSDPGVFIGEFDPVDGWQMGPSGGSPP
jgi:hypothetical protein